MRFLNMGLRAFASSLKLALDEGDRSIIYTAVTVIRVVPTRKLIPRSKAKASIITLNADFCVDVKLPLAWYIFAVATCKAVKKKVVSHRSSRRRYLISTVFVVLMSRKRSSVLKES